MQTPKTNRPSNSTYTPRIASLHGSTIKPLVVCVAQLDNSLAGQAVIWRRFTFGVDRAKVSGRG